MKHPINMKQFDTLYARDSKGRINEWSIKVLNENEIKPASVLICIYEGLIDGQKTQTERSVPKGKNIGKMNETSAYEQACSESQSRWEKKKKQGYKSLNDLGIDSIAMLAVNFNSVLEKALPTNRTDANNISKPMKAQQYYKYKTVDGVKVKTNEPLIKFPCFGQPKLNGFRVMARWEKVKEGEGLFAKEVEKVVFRSKEGLRYDILEHIETEMDRPMFLNPATIQNDLAYDGEMYIHREILSEISSAVRKRNPKTEKLRFCVFDAAIERVSQKIRLDILKDNFNYSKDGGLCKTLDLVETTIINSDEEAQTFTDECIRQGYEGAIFRDMKAEYAFGKRPQTMTKLKRSDDKEFTILDVVGGDNAPELGVFVCQAENGKSFKCTPEGSHEVKREYLSNKGNYIGKKLTIRFFERTIEGLPFHGVGVAVRDYED